MKVLSIGTDRSLFDEGSAVRARTIEYAKLFEELHVVVFTRRNSQFSILNSQPISKIQISNNCWAYATNSRSRWWYVFDAVRLGIRIIENCKLNIEHSRNNFVVSGQDPFECGLAASRIARRFKLPLHIQIHTDFLSSYFLRHSLLNRIRVWIAKRVLPRASSIRVVSARILSSLKAKSYKLKTLPVVLPIFTDLEKFKHAMPTFSLHDKYPQWDFIMLMVTRLSSEKNVEFALRVLAELRKKYPKVGMVIVGSGSELVRLRLKAISYQLSASVAFEGRQDDVISYYKTADLFLQTSLYEGFGLALLEAVAAGCPAVSSDVGIAPELLNADGRSFVCPVNDTACFVRIISECIEDKNLRAFFATHVTPAAFSRFSRTKADYLSAYRASLASALQGPTL